MINLFLISDQEVLKDNIRSWIKTGTEIRLLGTVNKNTAAFRNLKEMNADIIAVDFEGNSGEPDIIKSLKGTLSAGKILVLYPHGQENGLFKIYKEGVRGFLMKDTENDDFILALKKLHRDKKFICTELAMFMLQEMMNKPGGLVTSENSVDISRREMEVLRLISDGYTNHEIADKLFTSRRTVETHRKNLIQKTDTKNTAHLIKYAVYHGIIK